MFSFCVRGFWMTTIKTIESYVGRYMTICLFSRRHNRHIFFQIECLLTHILNECSPWNRIWYFVVNLSISSCFLVSLFYLKVAAKVKTVWLFHRCAFPSVICTRSQHRNQVLLFWNITYCLVTWHLVTDKAQFMIDNISSLCGIDETNNVQIVIEIHTNIL